ncbi:STAS domain-containing protein [Mycobacterium marinum]|uniref:STAS domain-containing protein n=1 Tax=Mycobacterium marinum TaxID=1781 RepID=UPI000E3C2DA8|nr:STAS domain-containing protein [Mycobacterium marinum]RFZ09055.1 Anti-sigma-F factor antagonist RsfB [Mycobacterium marinum]
MVEQSSDPTPPTVFGIEKSRVGEAVVVTVSGELDMLTAPRLAEMLRTSLIEAPATLIVDLSKVDFLASAGMTVLVSAKAQAVAPTRFAVVADGPATSRPIRLMGIDAMLPLYDALDDALNDISDS